jgi:hypothetical protein
MCHKGVRANSLGSPECKIKQWFHKKCRGLSGSSRAVAGFECSRCVEGTGREETMKEMEVEHIGKLEYVSKFCYLRGMGRIFMLLCAP